jgi:hypothetical protein
MSLTLPSRAKSSPSAEANQPTGAAFKELSSLAANSVVTVRAGGGSIEPGQGLGSFSVTKDSPLVVLGRGGEIGSEMGVMLTKGTVYEDPKNTDNLHSVSLIDFVGLHYRTPDVSKMNLEVGGRMGIGITHRIASITKDGSSSPNGPKRTGLVPSVYLAASTAFNAFLGIRFEIARHFSSPLQLGDTVNTAQAAMTLSW